MKKVFVFCIGGTGERVMKSITMLMASGMDTCGYTVVPIIIDPHLNLDEKKNLQTLIDNYIDKRNKSTIDGKGPNGFFGAEMDWIGNLDTQTNNTNKEAGEDRSYAEYLNVGNLRATSINNYLIQTLYSTENLNSKLSVGFRGNPNVGTVVLQEMLTGASWSDGLKSHCGPEDRVFIISSIFGGTGASGYPLLERKIRSTMDSDNLRDVFMGAVTVLPYYGLTDPKKNNSQIDSGNFMTKAKAALTYYENTVKSDLLYYVGETTLQVYHENNENTQPDDANFVELVAATALFDFLQRSKPKERQYLTRAIENDVSPLSLSSAGKGYATLVKCLADFRILKMLLDVLPKEKYFPLRVRRGFNDEFYNGDLSKVNIFANNFEQWYGELSSTKRAFAPISEIKPSQMSDIIKESIELKAKDDSYYLLEMIKNSKIDSGNKVKNFLDYAHIAIDTYTKTIL